MIKQKMHEVVGEERSQKDFVDNEKANEEGSATHARKASSMLSTGLERLLNQTFANNPLDTGPMGGSTFGRLASPGPGPAGGGTRR